ncbi:unannotated protein [freshwater metagenome]|uniref:Unannotated protein n=1 Tax=freshwater metagenome TaxID=449393 RepID=A0A6J7RKJ3_9ZZZZ
MIKSHFGPHHGFVARVSVDNSLESCPCPESEHDLWQTLGYAICF